MHDPVTVETTMDLALLIPIFGIILTMIPVAGVTLVLTVRYAVKPLVETLADAVRESRGGIGNSTLAAQVRVLAEEVETLSHEVRELRSAQDFDRELLAEADASRPVEP